MFSILFNNAKDRLPDDQVVEPIFFRDLNFDQIVKSVTSKKKEYNLKPFFYMPLHSPDAVLYRHEVIKDLEKTAILKDIEDFTEHMQNVRSDLSMTDKDKDYYEHQNERWFLDAVNKYIKAINELTKALEAHKPESRGLQSFARFIKGYVGSSEFKGLSSEAHSLEEQLKSIRYEVLIEGLRVEVRHYNEEPNYSTEIQSVFKRFSQDADRDYEYGFREKTDMNHVEGKILDLVAQSYGDIFSKLTDFRKDNKSFINPTIALFDREVQFYVSYLHYTSKIRKEGLNFCYPKVSDTAKEVLSQKGFDLALAHKLNENGKKPVTNDFYLKGSERIIVVSGPNQGGKTTFARTFGQLHYLASLGLLTPGSSGQFYLPDTIFTHFEKQEDMLNLRGKLEDDLVRVHEILDRATPKSIILINEIFTSTTLHDAIELSKKVAATIMKLDDLCVWVTFIDELSTLSSKTISMVSEVVPNKPAVRTFKITRKPADGLAYALSIAEKHKLTETMISRRIKA